MTRIAKETGLNREGLYKTLSGEGNPELDTLLKVIKAVGLQLHATLKAC
jgi:probable addiction module antidote protein